MKLDYDFGRPMEIEYLYRRPIEIARKAGYEMKESEKLYLELKNMQNVCK
jgi:2-dehydropantoate 2-reductase